MLNYLHRKREAGEPLSGQIWANGGFIAFVCLGRILGVIEPPPFA